MPNEYRILERAQEGKWEPFAVAYRDGDEVRLFSPAWRAPRRLGVTGLRKLTAEHFSGGEGVYRWASEVRRARREARHPVDFLREAMAIAPAAGHEPEGVFGRLMVALRDVSAVPSRGVKVKGGAAGGAKTPDAVTLVRDLEDYLNGDEDARRAYVNLRAALANEKTRPVVIQALEAFARAAKGAP